MSTNYKIKIISLVLLAMFLFGCMRTYKLQDGITKVPRRNSVYKNKMKFTKALTSIIDTSVIYEEIDVNYNVLKRSDNHIDNSFYGVYRFYGNGYFNYFIFNRDTPFESNLFNPQIHGYRGVYYLKKDKICYDLFCTINQAGWLGLLTGHYKTKGDTLYVTSYQSKGVEIYIKRKLPEQFINHKPIW